MLLVDFNKVVSICLMAKICAGVILPLVDCDWLKWSCDKHDTQRDSGLGFRELGFRPRFIQHTQEAANSLLALKS